jgi:NAD(P)-dependent dehydrogenase (short-subunit alcohol dehydrogenase family)
VALLDGKVAVVTGGGRGLGRAHALALAAAGAAVLVNDLGSGVEGAGTDATVAGAVVDEIRAAGGIADADTGDVSSVAAGARLVQRALDAFGRVDVVVNNAGISRRTLVADLDDEVLDLHLGVHLKATVGTTRASFAAMATSGGGRIVNTVSGAGLDPAHPESAAYASAKAAVYAFTKVAAIEGAACGVTVNAVSPLAVTRMSETFFARADPAAAARLDPSRVSDVVVYLASDLSAGVTGRILRVEGGQLSEAYMTRTPGADADRWEPAALAARIAEVLRPT